MPVPNQPHAQPSAPVSQPQAMVNACLILACYHFVLTLIHLKQRSDHDHGQMFSFFRFLTITIYVVYVILVD